MKKFKYFPVTIVTALFASIIFLLGWFLKVDLYENVVTFLISLGRSETAIIIIPIIVVSGGIAIDLLGRKRNAFKILEFKFQTLSSTMLSVKEHSNNSLNKLKSLRHEVEQVLNQHSLQEFDEAIETTKNSLREMDKFDNAQLTLDAGVLITTFGNKQSKPRADQLAPDSLREQTKA